MTAPKGYVRSRTSRERSIDRAWRILHEAREQRSRGNIDLGLSAAEIVEQAPASRSVVIRLLRAARALRWVEMEEEMRPQGLGRTGVARVPVYRLTARAPSAAPVLRVSGNGVEAVVDGMRGGDAIRVLRDSRGWTVAETAAALDPGSPETILRHEARADLPREIVSRIKRIEKSGRPQRSPAPPSVMRARREARWRDWIARAPIAWTPHEQIDGEAWITMAVLGALRAGGIVGVEMAWDGRSLRGDLPKLLRRLRDMQTEGSEKNLLHLSASGRLQWVRLRLGGDRPELRTVDAHWHMAWVRQLDMWAGQITAERIWRTCAEAIDPDAGVDQTATACSATGYDWRGITDAERDGFSLTKHSWIKQSKYPVVEMLALIGGDMARRRGAAVSRVDGGSRILLPAIADRPFRDAADVRGGWRPWAPNMIEFNVRKCGFRLYIAEAIGPVAAPAPCGKIFQSRAAWLAAVQEKSS